MILVSSVLLAGATHAWLASGRAGLAIAAGVAFALTFGIGRVSLTLALLPALLSAAVAPALFFGIFGASDYNTTLIWLAALAGPVIAQTDLSHWHMPRKWAWPMGTWALVVAVSWPIVAGREIDFSLIAASTFDTTNAAYPGAPPLAAAWVTLVALGVMVGVLWFDLLWAQFAGGEVYTFERAVLIPLIVSTAIGAIAALYQGAVDIRWLNVWRGIDRAGGLMLDPNSFAIGAAMWGPVSVAAAWRMRRTETPSLMFLALAAAGVWLSGSRTALLALCVGALALGAATLQRRGTWRPLFGYGVAGGAALVLVLAMAFAPRDGASASPVQRVFDRLPRLDAVELERFGHEMWARFGYGTAAAQMTRDHPLAGTGIGSFHVVSADYLYRALGRRLDPDNAQNWWRHQIAELGALGAWPSLWISLLIVAAVATRGVPTEPVGPTTVLRGVLAGVGVASLLGVPTQHPASWLSFVTVLFYLLALPTLDARNRYWDDRGAPALAWALSLMLALGLAVGLAVTARGDLRVAERALRSELPYEYGLSPVEGTSEYGELRWAATRATAVIPVVHRYLRLTIWTPHTDIASNAVDYAVTLDGHPAGSARSTSNAPRTFDLQLPDGARWAVIELSASREVRAGQALRVGFEWRREPVAAEPRASVLPQ